MGMTTNKTMTKKYKLLKDLPDVKAGVIFIGKADGFGRLFYRYDFPDGTSTQWYDKPYVESNSEWFEEVVEEEEPLVFGYERQVGDLHEVRVMKDMKNGLFTYDEAVQVCIELNVRCALTREDVEKLIYTVRFVADRDSSSEGLKDIYFLRDKLQAILDAMGGNNE